MEKPCNASEIAKILGKPWSMKKVVDSADRILPEAESEALSGQGSRRKYGFKNLVQFRIYDVLRVWGYPRGYIKNVLRNIDKEIANDARVSGFYSSNERRDKEWFLITTEVVGKKRVTIILEYDRGVPIQIDPAEKVIGHFMVNISAIKRELNETIKELGL